MKSCEYRGKACTWHKRCHCLHQLFLYKRGVYCGTEGTPFCSTVLSFGTCPKEVKPVIKQKVLVITSCWECHYLKWGMHCSKANKRFNSYRTNKFPRWCPLPNTESRETT